MGISRLKGEYSVVAAAGTTQATASEVPAYMVMVTSGTGGVIIPPLNKDEEFVCCNGLSGEEIKVYPRTGGQINNATANLHLLLPPNSAARFKALNGAGSVIAFF
jgi:hypothetical protein